MSYVRSLFSIVLLIFGLSTACAGTLVQFFTPFGEIDVELFDQDKPGTTKNFIRLVESGAYNNSFFHRCVPGFVVQGGGFASINANSTSIMGPPWGNLVTVPNFGNITNEFNTGQVYSNVFGTIAMAKTSNPDSANSQFFFNIWDNPGLDKPTNSGGFTVFGRVVRNAIILDQFNIISKGNHIVDLRDTYGTNDALATVFKEVPTFASGTNPPPFNQLIYFIPVTVKLRVAAKTNGAEISWNSVGGITNHVEFSTVMPPVWQSLAATNGSGGAMTVTDPVITTDRRFYRVRFAF